MEKVIDKIMVMAVTDNRNYPDYAWKEPLQKNCRELVWVNLKKIYFENGRIKTQELLNNIFAKEKPDFLFVFDNSFYDLDIVSIINKFRIIHPKIKTIFFSGDDDVRFESVRYLALFFDFILTSQNDFVKDYRRDGRNAYFIIQTMNEALPETKKIYDVSFIGTPKSERKEFIEYLYEKGINLKVFGYNWDRYPSLKQIYGGVISSEDYGKIISQSRINLCFSMNIFGVPHMKSRFFEISNYKAFSLVEDSPQLKEFFKENKEIVFFKTKEDLLKKIKYYLNNQTEMEKITENAYKKIKTEFDFEKILSDFLKKAAKTPASPAPVINYAIANIDEEKIKMPRERLLEELKDFDYVSFSKGRVDKSPFKDYLQVYSLKKNKKEISCCDYFMNSSMLGRYGHFRYSPAGKTPHVEFQNLLNINQVVMTKNFLMENLDLIRRSYKENKINFINKDNACFVSLPLVSIYNFRKNFFKEPELSKEVGFFIFSFPREIYSRRKKPLKFISYLFCLALENIFGKRFILPQLLIKLSDKDIKASVKNLKK